jgi:hypothetical protein
MVDTDRPPPGRALLDAYRDERGPSPAAADRLLARLERDLADPASRDMSPRQVPKHRSPGTASPPSCAASTRPAAGWRPPPCSPPPPRSPRSPSAPASASSAPATTTPPPPSSATPATPKRPPPARPALAEHAPPARPPPAPATRPRREPATPAPSLTDEMQHMRPAQLALAAGDPQAALARLEDYARAFPGGRLREEYLALRAIARCQLGATDAQTRPPPSSCAPTRTRCSPSESAAPARTSERNENSAHRTSTSDHPAVPDLPTGVSHDLTHLHPPPPRHRLPARPQDDRRPHRRLVRRLVRESDTDSASSEPMSTSQGSDSEPATSVGTSESDTTPGTSDSGSTGVGTTDSDSETEGPVVMCQGRPRGLPRIPRRLRERRRLRDRQPRGRLLRLAPRDRHRCRRRAGLHRGRAPVPVAVPAALRLHPQGDTVADDGATLDDGEQVVVACNDNRCETTIVDPCADVIDLPPCPPECSPELFPGELRRTLRPEEGATCGNNIGDAMVCSAAASGAASSTRPSARAVASSASDPLVPGRAIVVSMHAMMHPRPSAAPRASTRNAVNHAARPPAGLLADLALARYSRP